MSPLAIKRMDRWHKGMTKQMPLTFAERMDFCDAAWLKEDQYSTLAVQLKRIDRNYEIIYDRSTAADAFSPAHHLYRVTCRGGVESADTLKLEFSLTEEEFQGNRTMWGIATPKAPGPWVLERARELDKARFSGSEKAIEEEQARILDEPDIEREKKNAHLDDEECGEAAQDMQKHIRDNKHRKRPKDRKVTSAPGLPTG